MKRCILSFVLLLCCIYCYGAVYIDGVYYDWNSLEYACVWGNADSGNLTNSYHKKEVVIPETITYRGITRIVIQIAWKAFVGSYGVESIKLPNTIRYIDEQSFEGCTNLISINLPDSIERIREYAFRDCKRLVSIELPKHLKNVDKGLFEGCVSLENVIIGNEITTIHAYAFEGCTNLRSITIPESVVDIEYLAFAECKNIKEIYVKNIVPPTLTGHWQNVSAPFRDVNKNECILYVPVGTKEVYAQSEGWNEFANIIEEDVTDIKGISACLGKQEFECINKNIIVKNTGNAESRVFNADGKRILSSFVDNDKVIYNVENYFGSFVIVEVNKKRYKVYVR